MSQERDILLVAKEAHRLAVAANREAEPFRSKRGLWRIPKGEFMLPGAGLLEDISYYVEAAEKLEPGTWERLQEMVNDHFRCRPPRTSQNAA